MAILSIRWLRRIGIAVLVVVAALALLWASSVLWGQWWLELDVKVIALAVLALVPFAAVVAAIWWLWWRLPRRQLDKLAVQIHDPKDRADTEDNFRKTVGQALGGAAVLIGAVAAYLQFTQQQQATRDQLQASHDLLISNQVSRGFEQLAGKETAMRLGGIYALEGVMNTSEQYHQPVIEALCAFVRESTKPSQVTLTAWLEALFFGANERTAGKVNDTPATDVQAALTVIGRRKGGLGEVNLVGANIPGADLFEAHLERANLAFAHLEGAYLAFANLKGAKFGEAHLQRAHLSRAHLERAPFYKADLDHADLTGAYLDDANLTGAHLDGASLSDADLSGADLGDVDLSGALGLNQAQLNQACGKPKLPPGLALDKSCPPERPPSAVGVNRLNPPDLP